MMVHLGLALLAGISPVQDTTLRVVTLPEALRLSAAVDPNYVAAIGSVANAEWGRRAARLAFITPSVTALTQMTKFSTEIFNTGTNDLATQIVEARIQASYPLFRGGSKFAELSRSAAQLESANASEIEARFGVALLTESSYYQVVAERELSRVAQDRVRRATEQLGVARARVVSGAAVQSDSLQLMLELNRARLDLLLQRSTLRVARLDLGRRIGFGGEVDAASLDSLPAPALPIGEAEAVAIAVSGAPSVIAARANERAAEASYRSTRGSYLPQVDLFAQLTAFDDAFFPNGTTRSLFGVTVSFPIWNQGQREIALTAAATNRDVFRAVRSDAEIQLRRDVIDGYQAYETARASAALAAEAVLVASENLRVQGERYRAGATTIIDLVTAQVDASETEARLVQARHATRLALAGIEAILGRRLF